mgnify:CR=1 FL=1
MRKQITRVGVIASRSAHRLYDWNIKPFADYIKHQEAKEVFASTVMLRASADLFHLLGNEYEGQLDMLVGIMKEQAKNARNEQ